MSTIAIGLHEVNVVGSAVLEKIQGWIIPALIACLLGISIQQLSTLQDTVTGAAETLQGIRTELEVIKVNQWSKDDQTIFIREEFGPLRERVVKLELRGG